MIETIKRITAIASVAICSFSYAQEAPFPLIEVDGRSGMSAPCEPSICINPLDSNNIVVGTILNRVHYSFDGGETWESDILKSPHGVWGDPVMLADDSGYVYYFHLSDPDGKNWSSDSILDRIVCQRSIDGGKTWNEGSYMGLNAPKDQDKQWSVFDPITKNIYVTWTQFDDYGSENREDHSNILFSKSEDRGLSWSDAIQINELSGNCLDGDSTTEGAVPAVGPNGEIYVAWAFDGKIWFDRSEDGGSTWLEEDIFVVEQPGGWDMEVPGIYRSNGMPVTVCDLSNGPNRGRIYVNWVDERNGANDRDVWVVYSDDKGQTWSEPVRVNNDSAGAHQFLTWMTVDQHTGNLFTVFYDRRGLEGNLTHVYLAVSEDGGESFENICLTDEPFDPNDRVFFGDYNNIAAHNGMVRPVWTRLDGKKLSVWTALVQWPKRKK